MTTYYDVIQYFNRCYENSRDTHNYAEDLEEMQDATSIERLFLLYDRIVCDNFKLYDPYCSEIETGYLAVINQTFNSNILRLFKDSVNPNEELMLKCVVNLRGGDINTAELISNEAFNKKNLANAIESTQKVISAKNKYAESMKRLKEFSKGTNGYNKVKIEISSLLKEINGYRYFHTKREKHLLSYYDLNETENTIKYIAFAICIILFLVLEWVILESGIFPWLLLFGFMFWLLGRF